MINVFFGFSFLFFLTQRALPTSLILFRKSFDTVAFLQRVRRGAGEMRGSRGNGECGSLTIFLRTTQGKNFKGVFHCRVNGPVQFLTRRLAQMACPYQVCSAKSFQLVFMKWSRRGKSSFHVQSDCSTGIEQGFGRRGHQCLKIQPRGRNPRWSHFDMFCTHGTWYRLTVHSKLLWFEFKAPWKLGPHCSNVRE